MYNNGFPILMIHFLKHKDFVAASARLAAKAATLGLTLHLRVGEDSKPPATLDAAALFLEEVAADADSLKLAMSTASLVAQDIGPDALDSSSLGLWLVSTPIADPFTAGAQLTVHGSLTALSNAQRSATAALLGAYPMTPKLMDVALAEKDREDSEFVEIRALESLLHLQKPGPSEESPNPDKSGRIPG